MKKGIIILFFFLSGMELVFAKPSLYSFADEETIAFRENAYNVAKREIKELNPENDHFVCLNSLATLYKIQSHAYLNDPFNYWMMWGHNILDVSPFVQAIEEKRFSLILLVVGPENPCWISTMRFFPAGQALNRINLALNEHYVMLKKGLFIYLAPRAGNQNRPKDPSP